MKKKLRFIVLISLMVSGFILAIVAPQYLNEYSEKIILVGGMLSGALAMLLIILSEYVFPLGLYVRVNKKTGKQIRIF